MNKLTDYRLKKGACYPHNNGEYFLCENIYTEKDGIIYGGRLLVANDCDETIMDIDDKYIDDNLDISEHLKAHIRKRDDVFYKVTKD